MTPTAFSLGLIILLPLLGSLAVAVHILSGEARGDAGERATIWFAQGSVLAALLGLLGLDGLSLAAGVAPGTLLLGTWFESGTFGFSIAFDADTKALAFATLIALVGWATVRFSVPYLHREAGFHRFFMVMGLFLSGMLTLVLSGNILMAFVGWEFCGISSFLLIAYGYERPAATGNALFAFVVNRVGDAGFLLGIALAVWQTGTLSWDQLAHYARSDQVDVVTLEMMLLGFFLAAFAKSAQLPFSPWIARALEGPTPSSAIFYGAIMVHAGVWLAIRLEPLLVQTPGMVLFVGMTGLATTLYGAIAGLVQTDVKSALTFASLTQVGLMFVSCALGWSELAAWHMILHGAWRSWQFLNAPSYMHVSGKTPVVPAWLAGRRVLFTAALQRFWLARLLRNVITLPVVRLGRDARRFDEEVLAPVVGMPPGGGVPGFDEAVHAFGLPGTLLAWFASVCEGVESRLIARDRGETVMRLLSRLERVANGIEDLLEEPRYLILMLIVTLAIIL